MVEKQSCAESEDHSSQMQVQKDTAGAGRVDRQNHVLHLGIRV